MGWIRKSFRDMVLKVIRSDLGRETRHNRFLNSRVDMPAHSTMPSATPTRILVLGVYMADRVNTVEHLVEHLKSSPDIHVEHRWVALKGAPTTQAVQDVTSLIATQPAPKFVLVNRLLRPDDIESFDYIIAIDDDIYLPEGFLPAFIEHQRQFDFAVAQPARAWHSHFDHAFVLRRPWLRARQTHFVECGPLVCFRRDAARLLLPFDQGTQMWGIDLVWAEVVRRHGLAMGIIDAISVDHSLRPQAQTYSKAKEDRAMHAYLKTRAHIPMHQAFTVVRRFR